MVTLDAGEGNDLHPYDKKLVADRVFQCREGLVYGRRLSLQPAVETIEVCGDLLRMHCVWRSRLGRADPIGEPPADDVGW